MEPVIAARWCKESTKKLTPTPPVLSSRTRLFQRTHIPC